MAEPKLEIAPARHERRDIGELFIWAAVGLMIVLLGASAAATYWLYPQARPERGPRTAVPAYPAPRLQTDPAADLRAFRARELRALGSRGWVDREQGVAHIPIEEAMRQIAAEGISGWPPP